MLEALAPCLAQRYVTHHPAGSVGIDVMASRSGTSPGCVSAHCDTLTGLGERGLAEQSWKCGWPECQQTLCVALLKERLNGNNFYLL